MTHRLTRRAAGLLAALLMTLGLGVASTAPAHAAHLLGGVSMQSWCNNYIAPGFTAKPVSRNVYGWRFVLGRYAYSTLARTAADWRWDHRGHRRQRRRVVAAGRADAGRHARAGARPGRGAGQLRPDPLDARRGRCTRLPLAPDGGTGRRARPRRRWPRRHASPPRPPADGGQAPLSAGSGAGSPMRADQSSEGVRAPGRHVHHAADGRPSGSGATGQLPAAPRAGPQLHCAVTSSKAPVGHSPPRGHLPPRAAHSGDTSVSPFAPTGAAHLHPTTPTRLVGLGRSAVSLVVVPGLDDDEFVALDGVDEAVLLVDAARPVAR